jgi:hypothetical protein
MLMMMTIIFLRFGFDFLFICLSASHRNLDLILRPAGREISHSRRHIMAQRPLALPFIDIHLTSSDSRLSIAFKRL